MPRTLPCPRLALLSLLCLPAASPADDWPQWFGPARDGVYREKGILEKFPQGGPKVLWRTPIGAGYAGPAVVGNRVLIADRVITDGAPLDASGFSRAATDGTERVLCLDAATGKELWKYEVPAKYRISYGSGPRATPTVHDGRVYSVGAMGHFACLELESGKELWKVDFLKDYEATLPVWGFSSPPLIEGDKVIALVGGSGGRFLVAFDRITGKEIWKAIRVTGDPGYGVPVVVTVGKARQLIAWSPQAVHAVDPQTGKLLWELPWEIKAALTATQPQPVAGDRLFLSSFYNGSMLLKLESDPPAAKVVWKSKSKGGEAAVMPNNTVDLHSIMATPWVVGDYIYGVCSYGELRCLKLETGERVWEDRGPITGKADRWGNAFLTPYGDGKWFLANEKGELIIARLSPEKFTELDRAKVIEPSNKMAGRPVVWTHPAYANQKMFMRNDREAICISLTAGAEK